MAVCRLLDTEEDEAEEADIVQTPVVPKGPQKPELAAADPEKEDGEGTPSSSETFSFSNKRLCERWLDNLFMVLYEVRRPNTCSDDQR